MIGRFRTTIYVEVSWIGFFVPDRVELPKAGAKNIPDEENANMASNHIPDEKHMRRSS
jgi:hypothetical protein